MSTLTIDTSTVDFKDSEGKVLCEGHVLDLYFTVAEFAKEGTVNRESYAKLADALKEDFRPDEDKSKYADDMSWGTAMRIALELNKLVKIEKKSTDPSQR